MRHYGFGRLARIVQIFSNCRRPTARRLKMRRVSDAGAQWGHLVMASKISFEAVETVIYDPVAPNREVMRSGAQQLGFRKLDAVGTFASLAERLAARTLDLLLCEVSGADGDVCKLVQSLRQGLSGTNPFAIVIATTWRREGGVINQVINSGADDLLARPFSTSLLNERLVHLVEHRKAFVVTSDYVGPDRRRDPRPDDKNELIDVPNPLRVKSLSGANGQAERVIAQAVAKAKELVSAEKMRRDAFQLCIQWRLIEHLRPNARDFSDMLGRMATLASEVKSRAAGTQHEIAGKWCESIIDCTGAIGGMIEHTTAPDPSHAPTLTPMMHLLGHAALTLGHMFTPADTETALVADLDAIAARFDVRQSAHAAS